MGRTFTQDDKHITDYKTVSHSKHNGEEIAIVEENDKKPLDFLVNEIKRITALSKLLT